jgi:large subunit ribosomal protein L7/L12
LIVSTQQKNIEELVDSLSHLSVLDMAKLKTALEDKWGVKAAAAAPMMMAQAAAPAAEAAAESTEFEVSLTAVDPTKKMGVIKVVREATGLGLKESKEFVEAVTPATPKIIKPSCSKQEADELSTKFKDSGGEIKVKGL